MNELGTRSLEAMQRYQYGLAIRASDCVEYALTLDPGWAHARAAQIYIAKLAGFDPAPASVEVDPSRDPVGNAMVKQPRSVRGFLGAMIGRAWLVGIGITAVGCAGAPRTPPVVAAQPAAPPAPSLDRVPAPPGTFALVWWDAPLHRAPDAASAAVRAYAPLAVRQPGQVQAVRVIADRGTSCTSCPSRTGTESGCRTRCRSSVRRVEVRFRRGTSNASARAGGRLLRTNVRRGRTTCRRLPAPRTRAHGAAHLGTAREVVFRALRSLVARKSVTTARTKIQIVDRSILERLVGLGNEGP